MWHPFVPSPLMRQCQDSCSSLQREEPQDSAPGASPFSLLVISVFVFHAFILSHPRCVQSSPKSHTLGITLPDSIYASLVSPSRELAFPISENCSSTLTKLRVSRGCCALALGT